MFVLDCERGKKTVTDFHQITNVVFCGYFYLCVCGNDLLSSFCSSCRTWETEGSAWTLQTSPMIKVHYYIFFRRISLIPLNLCI